MSIELLFNAIKNNNLNAIKEIINNGFNINNSKLGITPLHMAVILNKIEAVELLLENQANHQALDDLGRTSLHMAIILQNPHIAILLLQKSWDLNITDHNGKRAQDYLFTPKSELPANITSLLSIADDLLSENQTENIMIMGETEGSL